MVNPRAKKEAEKKPEPISKKSKDIKKDEKVTEVVAKKTPLKTNGKKVEENKVE